MDNVKMDSDKSIQIRGKNFHCSLCVIKITSEKAVTDHLRGKKHKRLLNLKSSRHEQAEKSVFVGGLNKLMSELALTDHFMKFGDVSKVIIDKNKGQFAIVEFSNKEAVLLASEEEKQTLMGQKITVRPREHKPFEFHNRGGRGDGKDKAGNQQYNRYGTIPSELQKAIVLRLSPAEDVSTQMKELVSLLELPTSGLKLRYLICDLLHEVFKEFFPSCEIYPFGSSVNGFGIQGADLDLHLELDASGFQYKFDVLVSGNKSEEEAMDASEDTEDNQDGMDIDLETASDKDILEMVAKMIRQCVPQCQAVRSVVHARRPVVKFQHKESKLSCDISLKNRLALRNTELLNFYTNLDERVRPLVYTIRHWGKVKQISGGAGPRLTNYALSLLVVYFLQTRDPCVLPSVDSLRNGNDTTGTDTIEGWDCSFSPPTKETSSTQSTVELLREFFHFYSTFDFTTNVISLKTGTALPISTFTPPESPVHEDQVFRLSAINIQDPFELSHNVAYNVSEKVVFNFGKEVKKAYTMTLANKFKKKPASVAATDLVAWGLPLLFDAESNRNNAPGGRGERKASTSTEGSVLGEDTATYSIPILMKASCLSEAFIKSQSDTNNLKASWCEATIAFIKKILSDVLKIECHEQSADERQKDANESSTEQCQSSAQLDKSISDDRSEIECDKDQSVSCESASVVETVKDQSMSCDSASVVEADTNDEGHEKSSESSAQQDQGIQGEKADKETENITVKERKHHLDDDENVPRKRTKLTKSTSDMKTDGTDTSVCVEDMSCDGSGGEVKQGTCDADFIEVNKDEAMEGSAQNDEPEHHIVCSTRHQVWLGRRKVRRQLNQSNPALDQTPSSPENKTAPSLEEKLRIETMVTDAIIDEDSAGGESPLAKFKVSFRRSQDTGQCCLKLVLQPVEGLAHFKALFQFLQLFLVKFVDQHQL